LDTPLGPGPEFDLIRGFLAGSGPLPEGVVVGPGDDCAVLEGGICVSTDASVEEVHFRRSWLMPDEIGWRAVAVAVSDLAAMAARPLGMLVTLSVNQREPGVAQEVMRGARAAAEEFGGALLGGDLTGSMRRLVVDVCAIGRAGKPVLRSGVQPGDEIWVTGVLGGAAAAVQAFLGGWTPSAAARESFARPRPRLEEAIWLQERAGAHAMIDLSDGIGGDAAHLAAASGVALVLEVDALPLHEALAEATAEEAFRLAASGGDDYELCFATRPGAVAPLVEEFEEAFGIPLTRVGVAEAGDGLWWDAHGERTSAVEMGFQHFGREE
jgi:thiamine-monophosphate kinase